MLISTDTAALLAAFNDAEAEADYAAMYGAPDELKEAIARAEAAFSALPKRQRERLNAQAAQCDADAAMYGESAL